MGIKSGYVAELFNEAKLKGVSKEKLEYCISTAKKVFAGTNEMKLLTTSSKELISLLDFVHPEDLTDYVQQIKSITPGTNKATPSNVVMYAKSIAKFAQDLDLDLFELTNTASKLALKSIRHSDVTKELYAVKTLVFAKEQHEVSTEELETIIDVFPNGTPNSWAQQSSLITAQSISQLLDLYKQSKLDITTFSKVVSGAVSRNRGIASVIVDMPKYLNNFFELLNKFAENTHALGGFEVSGLNEEDLLMAETFSNQNFGKINVQERLSDKFYKQITAESFIQDNKEYAGKKIMITAVPVFQSQTDLFYLVRVVDDATKLDCTKLRSTRNVKLGEVRTFAEIQQVIKDNEHGVSKRNIAVYGIGQENMLDLHAVKIGNEAYSF